ncbi:MAG: methyltransferase domain-containing protein [Candidatus Omnitrophica bacterium]|nr:methyltransferase domain-containing protein [Candidatus Omnitrophota bacterium]
MRRIAPEVQALVGIIAVAITLRVVLLTWGPRALLNRTWEYDEVARNLWAGRGFIGTYLGVPTHALVHPFYPWFCAGIYWFLGHPSVAAVQWAQVALVPAYAAVAYQLGRTLQGPWAGVLAAAGTGLHPGLLIFSLRPHALWLDSLCFLTVVWLTVRSSRCNPDFKSVGWLGAAMGWGLLARSSILSAFPIILGWLFLQWRGQASRLKRAAVLLGVASVIAAPWLVRNALVLKQPVWILTSGMHGFWLGNHPQATGGALDHSGEPLINRSPELLAAVRAQPDEIRQADLFRREAWGFIRSHPRLTLRRTARKWLQFWTGSQQTGAWYPPGWRRAYGAFYLALWIGTLGGGVVLWSRRRRRELALIAGFLAAISLTQSLFFVEGRHRWEVEALLVVVAACGLAHLLKNLSEPQEKYFAGVNESRFAWQTADSVIGSREASLLAAALEVWPSEGWVVEIGAGEGANLFHLRRLGGSKPLCLAMDAILEKALFVQRRQAPAVRGLCGDAIRLPLREGSARLVIIRDLLHHVEAPLEVLKEAQRVLGPGGHLVLIEPNGRNPIMALLARAQRAERLIRRSNPEWLQGLFRDFPSFTDLSVQSLDPLPVSRVVCHYRYGVKQLAASGFGRWLGRCENRLGVIIPNSRWGYLVLRCRRG